MVVVSDFMSLKGCTRVAIISSLLMSVNFHAAEREILKSKSNLLNTRLIPFRVSRVSGAHFRDLRQGTQVQCSAVASR